MVSWSRSRLRGCMRRCWERSSERGVAGVAGDRQARSRGCRVLWRAPGAPPLIRRGRGTLGSWSARRLLSLTWVVADPADRCCVVGRRATESRAHPPFTFIHFPFSLGLRNIFVVVQDLWVLDTVDPWRRRFPRHLSLSTSGRVKCVRHAVLIV